MHYLDSAAAYRKYLRKTVNSAKNPLRVEVVTEDNKFSFQMLIRHPRFYVAQTHTPVWAERKNRSGYIISVVQVPTTDSKLKKKNKRRSVMSD